jgi:succinoglycan biosynthesis transport protein ExoP
VQDLSGYGAELNQGEQMNSDLLTQLTVITSDTTLLAVIQRLHLEDSKPFAIPRNVLGNSLRGRERGLPLENAPFHREQALRAFHAHLKVEVVKGTRLIAVTYVDSDPVRAANIANTVVEASIEEYTNARFEASSRASKWLTDQLARLKQSVEDSQSAADAYQKQSGVSGLAVVSPTSGAAGAPSVTFNNLPLERLLELNRDLTNAEVTRTEKEAIYRMTQTQDPAVVLGIGNTALSTGSVLAQGSADLALLQDLRQKQAIADTRLATASSKYGAKNPAVIELQVELASIKEQITAELRRIQARSLNDLQLAVRTEEGIRQQVAAQQAEVSKTGDVAARLVVLQQQAQADRNLYQSLHSKLEEANVVAGIRGSNISVIDVARANMTPTSPKVSRNTGIGFLAGLVGGLVIAFAMSYLSDFIHDSGEISGIVPAPVLGTIPDFRDSRARQISAWRPWRPKVIRSSQPDAVITSTSGSEAGEAYRSFRTALLQSGSATPLRSLLFMSGSEGEGRTTTCVNTAAAFAAQGYRVLVVNADMRGSLESRYGISAGAPGLSSCLTGSAAAQDVVRPFPGVAKLSVMPSGPHVPNTVELLGEPRFEQLLNDLLTEFDYVFLDSPPALKAADARVIAQSVGGYVLIVRADQTTSRSLRSLSDWMRSSSCLPLGVCLNAAEI